MTFDWSHEFCLACDKQVESDGAAYCSESCRLTELERTSTPSSQASSPGLTPPSYPWATQTRQPSPTKFHLSPAYDFSNAQPYGSTPTASKTLFGNYDDQPTARVLTPSSSHTSLCSMQSTSTTSGPNVLSVEAKEELRAYAVSFEQVRTQRRRSY